MKAARVVWLRMEHRPACVETLCALCLIRSFLQLTRVPAAKTIALYKKNIGNGRYTCYETDKQIYFHNMLHEIISNFHKSSSF